MPLEWIPRPFWSNFALVFVIFKKKKKTLKKVFLVQNGGRMERALLAFQAWRFLLENPQPNGSMVSSHQWAMAIPKRQKYFITLSSSLIISFLRDFVTWKGGLT